jgi:hypothetical protein
VAGQNQKISPIGGFSRPKRFDKAAQTTKVIIVNYVPHDWLEVDSLSLKVYTVNIYSG